MEAPKCDKCGCSCGSGANVCTQSGAARSKLPGIPSTICDLTATYSSRMLQNGTLTVWPSPLGNNFISSSQPYLSQCPDHTGPIQVIFDPCTQSAFVKDPVTGNYDGLYGTKFTLTFSQCEFIVTDCQGNVWYFDEMGNLDRVTWPDGTTVYANYDLGNISQLQRTIPVGTQMVTDANVFTYSSTTPNVGRLQTVTFTRSVNPSIGIRRMVFSYYGSNEEFGSPGDLKTATEQILCGTTWVDHETSYYRYYLNGQTNGFQSGMKYALARKPFSGYWKIRKSAIRSWRPMIKWLSTPTNTTNTTPTGA